MTNSLEIEACGAAQRARKQNAQLIEFGTDKHFEHWKSGFQKFAEKLTDAGLWKKTVLLDIEWAAAVDGAKHPKRNSAAKLGRFSRRFQRGAREASRMFIRGESVGRALASLQNVTPTKAEEFANRATVANRKYYRYRAAARALSTSTVTMESHQLRISEDHKWGPQPFHYRDEDYHSIVEKIEECVTLREGENPEMNDTRPNEHDSKEHHDR